MGRGGKLRLEVIRDDKARRKAYETRIKCLAKEASELSTLCGVDVLVIHYPPRSSSGNALGTNQASAPTVWPEGISREESDHMIASYKTSESCGRSYNAASFLRDETTKVEEEIKELRKKKGGPAKYPTWNERYNRLSVPELRSLMGVLTERIENSSKKRDEILMNQDAAAIWVPTNQVRIQENYDCNVLPQGELSISTPAMMNNAGNSSRDESEENYDWATMYLTRPPADIHHEDPDFLSEAIESSCRDEILMVQDATAIWASTNQATIQENCNCNFSPGGGFYVPMPSMMNSVGISSFGSTTAAAAADNENGGHYFSAAAYPQQQERAIQNQNLNSGSSTISNCSPNESEDDGNWATTYLSPSSMGIDENWDFGLTEH